MYDILQPIKHGKANNIFRLEQGTTVEDDFFTEDEKKRLLKSKPPRIRKVVEEAKEPTPVTPEVVEPLEDLSQMSVSKAKEILNDVHDVTKLERFLDQERGRGEFQRKSLTRFIEGLIHEKTGFKYSNK